MKVLKRVERLEDILIPPEDLEPVIIGFRWLDIKDEDAWKIEIPAHEYYESQRRRSQRSWPRRRP